MYGSIRLADRSGGKARWTTIAAALIALTLAGCGGRSDSDDGNGNGGEDNNVEAIATDIALEASSTTLAPSSTNPVEITAVLRDSNNNLVEGVDVDFSADNGTLTATQPTTNNSGEAVAELLPGDLTSGTITVTAQQGDAEATIQIEVAPIVSGISLSTSSSRLPSTGGQKVEITALLRDANNNAVAGADVRFSADAGVLTVTQPTSNASGEAIAELAPGDLPSGTITVTASRGDIEATTEIEVFSVVADVSLQASSVRLASSGDSPVELLALLLDSNNNVVEGADVQFVADSGAIRIIEGTTQAAGQASAELRPLTAGNRTITVTAIHESEAATIEIEVFGTELAINGPSSLNPGGSGDYTVTLQDSAGNPIANQTVSVASAQGNTIAQSNPVTDNSGQARFSVNNVMSSDDTLTVSALGATATLDVDVSDNVLTFTGPDAGTLVALGSTQTLTVDLDSVSGDVGQRTITFGASRGTLSAPEATTDADGTATVDISSGNAGPATITAETSIDGSNPSASLAIDFIATQPKSLEVQASPSQLAPTESATITATVRDANGNLVRDQQIFFNLVDNTNGGLDRTSATTNDVGRASVVYTASSTSGGRDGVEITAKVGSTTIADTVSLTVGGEALRLTLNTGNTLNTEAEVRYLEPWTVLVTDASGNPVANKEVGLSINPLYYYKGRWVPVDTDGDGEADAWGKAYSSANEGDLDMGGKWPCISEDRIRVEGLDPENTRFNGLLDENLDATADEDGDGVASSNTEDIDGDGSLEPENTTTVNPGTVTTDDTGFADFVVAYPQGNATWTRVRLRATVSVAGTEQSETNAFDLRVLADDINDLDVTPPGGVESPYGELGDCTNPL